jgi:conjugal transfer/type IV secretion protein DotA/TraY
MIMPRIVPRFRRLFTSGFGGLSLLIAQLYAMVRLLPPDHPYLNPENIGSYGIHNVIAEAAGHLVIKKENIDQILIFTAILLSMLLMLSQIILLAYTFLISPAAAQLAPPANMFDTPSPPAPPPGENHVMRDMAFILLDKVFGVPGIFCNMDDICTGVLTGGTGTGPGTPLPFHTALHKLLQFYSTGILLVGVVIFLYYLLVVIFETASTGSPFGQRFQNSWVPIRLVVALGLLIPIHHGLNSAQYITLFAAKFGSGFATNGWILFNRTMENDAKTPLGEKGTALAKPTAPDLTPVIQAMSMVHACAYGYWHTDDANLNGRKRPPHEDFYIQPYFVKAPNSKLSNTDIRMPLTDATPYVTALNFYNNSDVFVRFGRYRADNNDYLGQIEPLCGDIRIPITDLSHRGETDVGGAEAIQNYYYDLVKFLWFGEGDNPDAANLGNFVLQMSQRYMAVALRQEGQEVLDPLTGLNVGKSMECIIGCDNTYLPSCTFNPPQTYCDTHEPSGEAREYIIGVFNDLYAIVVENAWLDYNENTEDFDMDEDILALGWGGAGSWYNKINQMNGAFSGAVHNMPISVKFPAVMEEVRRIRREEDQTVRGFGMFQPNKSDGESIGSDQLTSSDLARAKALYNFYKWWNKDDSNLARMDKQITGRAFEDVMNAVFGTHNLMAMRGQNAHIHPMAQLTALGKGLVDSAIMNVTASSATALIAGLTERNFGTAFNIVSEFLSTTAFLGLTAGFILYYILPFMPFLYFFFALGEWVKAIFEAMVGVPLWALAHLRLAGEGLPGQSAASGYFMILDIFLRPIMTVFGLIAAMVIFTGQVRLLHLIWDLVIDNLTGFAGQSDDAVYDLYIKTVQRGIIDNFFFTVVYAVIVYMLATASFKLIDSIPDKMMRWMQGGVSTFGDINQTHQSIQQINQYAAISGISFGQQAVGAFTGKQGQGGLMRGVGGIAGRLMRGGK